MTRLFSVLTRKTRLTITDVGVVDTSLPFIEYLREVYQTMERHPSLRVGQAHFNVLYVHRPDLSEQIRGGEYDPFYVDSLLSKFLTYVHDNW